jgi:hypothetical protein
MVLVDVSCDLCEQAVPGAFFSAITTLWEQTKLGVENICDSWEQELCAGTCAWLADPHGCHTTCCVQVSNPGTGYPLNLT